MKRILWLFFVGFAISFCALTTAAQAQASRTWVSGVGDDANPCSRTAPCKTFAGSISKTADCGEIDALDPGGFGGFTITKGITIDGGGGQVASILVAGTPGITISNSSATCRSDIIRNLDIAGVQSGTIGINLIGGTAGAVSIEHVKIYGFTQQCFNINPTSAQLVTVIDSQFEYCSQGGLVSTSTSVRNIVAVSHSTFNGNNVGVTVHANTYMSLQFCQINDNTAGGVLADTAASAKVDIDHSVIGENLGYGIHATAGALVDLSNTSVVFNGGQGLLADAGGSIMTWTNNWVNGNTPDGSRSGTIAPM
jgi:hypothetical protein